MTNHVDMQMTGGTQFVVSVEDADLAEYRWKPLRRNYPYPSRNVWDDQRKCHTVILHRLVMERVLGRELTNKEFVDHINGNPLDNRRENLRVVSLLENARNKAVSRSNKAGLKGVCFHKRQKKWIAQILVNGKHIWLGTFDDPIAAHSAYIEAAEHHFGEYAASTERTRRGDE